MPAPAQVRNIGVEGATVTGGDGGALTRQLDYGTVRRLPARETPSKTKSMLAESMLRNVDPVVEEADPGSSTTARRSLAGERAARARAGGHSQPPAHSPALRPCEPAP